MLTGAHVHRHMDIQTDAYLEELTDLVPEMEQETQTDAFLDRPITPAFIPQKRGADVETQIEDGDLFDFDYEVEPILEVIVGKTLEQGLMEVVFLFVVKPRGSFRQSSTQAMLDLVFCLSACL